MKVYFLTTLSLKGLRNWDSEHFLFVAVIFFLEIKVFLSDIEDNIRDFRFPFLTLFYQEY